MPPPSSSSAPFRSHLMQQFAAGARNPARTPPLALVGWMDAGAPEEAIRRRTVSNTASVNGIPRATEATSRLPNPFASVAAPRSSFSTVASKETEEVGETAETVSQQQLVTTHSKAILPSSPSELSLAFQTMIRTRRTARQFHYSAEEIEDAASFYEYEMATLRAVQLAYSAAPENPPFFFQRILSAAAKDQLATIAANVYFAQELLEFQRLGQADALPRLRATAARKRDQWRRMPAYIVTLLSSKEGTTKEAPAPSKAETETNQVKPPPPPQFETLFDQDNITYSDLQIYQPSPAWKVRSLDDFAAACAATQNAVLSLHAERYATKWASD